MQVDSVTCPSCRHVVEVKEGIKAKCPNCGAMAQVPPARPPSQEEILPSAGPAVAPEAEPQTGLAASTGDAQANARIGPADYAAGARPTGEVAPKVEVAAMAPSGPAAGPYPMVTDRPVVVTRPASVAAFVLGLLFFVPFLTQAAAVVLGLVAIIRPRKPLERVRLAWIGLLLGLVMLAVWIFLFVRITQFVATAGPPMWMPPAVPPYAGQWEETASLQSEMEIIYQASMAYQRDFRRWPRSLDVLLGNSLPSSFVLSDRLTYRPVPESQSLNFSWLLLVSEPIHYDDYGEPLPEPHRFVMKLNGTIELLPAETVRQLLATQEQQTQPAETPSSQEPDGD